MATSKPVYLGFVKEEFDSRLLACHYFPSKIGGRPAWLSLNPIPSTEDLTCSKCGNPMVFLLQVYSPRDQQDEAFHRTLFVFACRTPGCSSSQDNSSFAVFRSQLPRANKFYSYEAYPEEPAEYSGPIPSASMYSKLCAVCGCTGSKKCGQCQSVSYCSKHHQARHWRAAHKKVCKKQDTASGSTEMTDEDAACGILFPEFELEDVEEEYTPDTTETDEAKAMADYHKVKAELVGAEGGSMSEMSEKELEDMAAQETEDDKHFRKFKKRVALDPDQVLRYNRGGEPLWVSHEHQAKPEDVPQCSCGAPRAFEFQVMPQLLNYLKVDDKAVDSLDWGTLCVYTCSKSCTVVDKYATEFIWKQDFVEDAKTK